MIFAQRKRQLFYIICDHSRFGHCQDDVDLVVHIVVRSLRKYYECSIFRMYLRPLIWKASSLLSMAGVSWTVLRPYVSCATTMALYTCSFHLFEQSVLYLYQNVLSLLQVLVAMFIQLLSSLHLPAWIFISPLKYCALSTCFHGLPSLKCIWAFPFIATSLHFL